MSSIFNLFGATTPINQQSKIDSFNTNSTSLKNFGRVHENLAANKLQATNITTKKQKGLSFRCKVDPNVSTTNVNTVVNKNVDVLKPKIQKKEDLSRLTTPLNKKPLLKHQIPINDQNSAPPCSKSPHHDALPTPNSINFTFKKPNTPKKIFKYPEPEQLSNDWSEEQKFYQPSFEDSKLETNFCNEFKKIVIPFEDDDSHPVKQVISTLEVEELNDIYELESPDMPSVSDDEV